MSNQPPYGDPGGYPPPGGGGYQGGGFPPPGGGGYGYGGGGGYPPPPQDNKTKTLGMSYNVAAMLCYLPSCLCCLNLVFSILFFATEPKENKFMRFHGLQGMLLYGDYLVTYVLFYIVGIGLSAGTAFSPDTMTTGLAFSGISLVFFIVEIVVFLILLIIHIVAMVKANQMQMWKLPVIGDIADKNT